jgi:hypothetical protein
MCSPYGIRDFPILNSVPVTTSLNASIYDEIPLDIQWGPKATAPSFIYSGAFANLGYLEYMGSEPSTTTLRFNGNTFTLISVQLCTPQHQTLLPQDKQRDCSGELVMGFKTQSSVLESYIFLCVPIVTRPTTKLSVYLEALRLDRLDGQPTSLLTVLPPSDQHYISYSTCLQRAEQTSTTIKQARVIVFTEGLNYPAANFEEIARKVRSPPPSGRIFLPTIQLPDGLADKTEAMLFSISTETDYKALLRYSQYYPQGQPDSSTTREDNLNSYKCVPLDPSQNIKDGKIVVNTENGELLSQVLSEKEEEGKVKQSRITPAMIQRIIAIGLAIILIIFVVSLVAYAISYFTTPNADSFFNVTVRENIGPISATVALATLSGVVFFILGFFLHSLI